MNRQVFSLLVLAIILVPLTVVGALYTYLHFTVYQVKIGDDGTVYQLNTATGDLNRNGELITFESEQDAKTRVALEEHSMRFKDLGTSSLEAKDFNVSVKVSWIDGSMYYSCEVWPDKFLSDALDAAVNEKDGGSDNDTLSLSELVKWELRIMLTDRNGFELERLKLLLTGMTKTAGTDRRSMNGNVPMSKDVYSGIYNFTFGWNFDDALPDEAPSEADEPQAEVTPS